MTMNDWATREIMLAIRKERGEDSDGEGNSDGCEYGVLCYKSALKAYRCLLEDEHSGFSISVTKNILNRLIDGKPLTPIEDVDDVWNHMHDDPTTYQCSRMSSLFKTIGDDGKVTYSDINRDYCIEIDDEKNTYTTGLVTDIINEMYPITMPYVPAASRIKVYCDTCLVDAKNGDFDTRAVLYCILPSGEKVEIQRYFKDKPGGWDEITRDEFLERKAKAIRHG